MRILVLFALIVLSVKALAEPVPVVWEHPTERVDGAALPITEISATRIEWAREGDPFTNSLTVPAPATEASVDIASGRWCFRAFTVGTDGLTSLPTTVLCLKVNAKPNSPTIIRIGRGSGG
jgi:hypothetical protein